MSWFVVICLLVNTLTVIFLVFAAVFFYNSARMRWPSVTQSWIAFWICLILAIICLILGVWSVFKLLSMAPVVAVPLQQTTLKPVATAGPNVIPLSTNVAQSDQLAVAIPSPQYN
jgi:hypothetical protein